MLDNRLRDITPNLPVSIVPNPYGAIDEEALSPAEAEVFYEDDYEDNFSVENPDSPPKKKARQDTYADSDNSDSYLPQSAKRGVPTTYGLLRQYLISAQLPRARNYPYQQNTQQQLQCVWIVKKRRKTLLN